MGCASSTDVASGESSIVSVSDREAASLPSRKAAWQENQKKDYKHRKEYGEFFFPGGDRRLLMVAAFVGDVEFLWEAAHREGSGDAYTFLSGITDRKGRTLAHYAAAGGSEAVLTRLLDVKNATRTRTGATVAHCAAQHGRLNVLEYLERQIGEAAVYTQRDNDGWTVVHFAAWGGHVAVLNDIRTRVSYGSDKLRVTAGDGSTIAHIAAARGNANVLHFVQDNFGSAFLYARRFDGKTIADLSGWSPSVHQFVKAHPPPTPGGGGGGNEPRGPVMLPGGVLPGG